MPTLFARKEDVTHFKDEIVPRTTTRGKGSGPRQGIGEVTRAEEESSGPGRRKKTVDQDKKRRSRDQENGLEQNQDLDL